MRVAVWLPVGRVWTASLAQAAGASYRGTPLAAAVACSPLLRASRNSHALSIANRPPQVDIGVKNKRNYYRILHVQPDAPTEVIRASYRTLMQKLKQHPDLGGEHWNASVINEAHEVLVDADRRHAYDRMLFGEKGRAALGRQHAQQRQNHDAQAAKDDGWRPFRPKTL